MALERHAERAEKKARGLQLQLEQVESTWSGESASQLQADELRTLRCALEDALARVRQEEAARRKRAASVKGFTDSKVSSYGARAQREARQNKRRLRQNVLAQVRAPAPVPSEASAQRMTPRPPPPAPLPVRLVRGCETAQLASATGGGDG